MEHPQESESLTIVGRWHKKFSCALRGLLVGVRGQNSFYVHIPAMIAVIGLAIWLQLTLIQWSILFVCITMVIAAELFNTAIEHLAKVVAQENNPQIRNALDTASGAVLVASLGAAIVGILLLGWPIVERWTG